MVKALEITEMVLILNAISLANGINEKTRPSSKKSGAPGGCGTAILKLQAINSPQSQKDTAGAAVKKYTVRAIKKIISCDTFSHLY